MSLNDKLKEFEEGLRRLYTECFSGEIKNRIEKKI